MILENGCIIDKEDFLKLEKEDFNIYVNSRHKRITIRKRNTTRKEKMFFLSRYLLSAPQHLEVDHINGNTMDNRRKNLRLATPAQNKANTRSSSKYNLPKGVTICWHNSVNPFYVRAFKDGKAYCLGYYNTIKAAALAYNKKAKELHGEFAKLNDIKSIVELDITEFTKWNRTDYGGKKQR